MKTSSRRYTKCRERRCVQTSCTKRYISLQYDLRLCFQVVMLDRWQIEFSEPEITDEEGKGDPIPLHIINNYFSIGVVRTATPKQPCLRSRSRLIVTLWSYSRTRRSRTDGTRCARSIRRSSTVACATSCGISSVGRQRRSCRPARSCTRTLTSWCVEHCLVAIFYSCFR